MKKKAFVLLSGGLDSTTCLYQAMKDFYPELGLGDNHIPFDEWVEDRQQQHSARGYVNERVVQDIDGDVPNCDWVEAVSVFYGQRHKRELDYAKNSCQMFGIKHTILDVGSLLSGKNILLSADSIGSMDMVHMSYDDIKGVSPSYVPFRNGLLLSAITAHAQKYVNEQIEASLEEGWTKEAATHQAKDLVTIYYGAHAEDAANWAYPDCTPEFNGSMANAIYTGSYNTIRLATPLQWSKKYEIVEKGANLGVDFASTWSCYDNGEKHCGKCPTCLARKDAFVNAYVDDPTEYANG